MSSRAYFTQILSASAVLFLFLAVLAAHAQTTDTDGAGMPNTWEIANGLNPNSALDGLMNKDGDRIPNLWEMGSED